MSTLLQHIERAERGFALATGGAIVAGLIMGAGVANADVNDDAFIQVINEKGISYTTEEKLIAAGHAVCDARNQGYTEIQVINAIVTATELDQSNTAYFVGAAETAYCPQYVLNNDPQPNDGPLKRLI
jgi:hypothetical protein